MSYYYSCLSSRQRGLYDRIFEGVNELDRKIALPLAGKNDLFSAFNSVIYDNPIMFYTRAFHYANNKISQRTILSPVYKYEDDFTDRSADFISDFLSLFDAVRNEGDLEKELFVHDYCLDNFVYDHDFNEYAFSVLGPVVFGSGVCEGISKFVKLVLNYLGVECIVVAGRAFSPTSGFRRTEPHMWNMVTIQGDTYHLDVTFNMTNKGKINRYDYFNLPDVEIKKDHTITGKVPVCNTVGNDYYSLSSQVVHSLTEMENYIRAELLSGKTTTVVKLSSGQSGSNIIDKIVDMAMRQFQSMYNRDVSIEVRYNPKQHVYEVGFHS